MDSASAAPDLRILSARSLSPAATSFATSAFVCAVTSTIFAARF
jgi:hypothetical protein